MPAETTGIRRDYLYLVDRSGAVFEESLLQIFELRRGYSAIRQRLDAICTNVQLACFGVDRATREDMDGDDEKAGAAGRFDDDMVAGTVFNKASNARKNMDRAALLLDSVPCPIVSKATGTDLSLEMMTQFGRVQQSFFSAMNDIDELDDMVCSRMRPDRARWVTLLGGLDVVDHTNCIVAVAYLLVPLHDLLMAVLALAFHTGQRAVRRPGHAKHAMPRSDRLPGEPARHDAGGEIPAPTIPAPATATSGASADAAPQPHDAGAASPSGSRRPPRRPSRVAARSPSAT